MILGARIVAVCGLSLAIVGLGGCGGDAPHNKAVSVTPSGPPPLKKMMEDVATSGELGSGAMEIESAVEDFKKQDPAAGEEVAKLYKDMQAAQGNPAKVKQIAKQILDKLH